MENHHYKGIHLQMVVFLLLVFGGVDWGAMVVGNVHEERHLHGIFHYFPRGNSKGTLR